MAAESERIVGLYQRHAKEWAADRGNRLLEKSWLDRFRDLLPSRGTALDIGCGSGEPIARYLIEQGTAVTGVDSSPEMIGMCRDRFPEQDWQVSDMRELSLNRTFSGIIAWDSFFHLCHDDQRRMFPIFGRHAAAHGALMFTSGPSYGEAIGCLKGEPLYHASLDPSEYRTLLDANGFEVVGYVAEDPTCGHRTIWLARLR